MKTYFQKKEYIYLYLTRFCYAFSEMLINIFGAVLLYKNDLSIAQIFLIFGLRFGLMGLCTPLFLAISSKVGVGFPAAIANIVRIICAYFIIFNITDNVIILAILLAIPGALANPIGTAVSVRYVESAHRGKYNSLRNVAKIAGSACGSVCVLYSEIANNSYFLLTIISLFYALDAFFTYLVNYKSENHIADPFKTTWKLMLQKPSSLERINMLMAFYIAEGLFLPLFLYIEIGNFTWFAAVIIIALAVRVFVSILWGRQTDRNLRKAHGIISVFKIISSAFFIILRNKMALSVNKIAADNIDEAYVLSYRTTMENMIKKESSDHILQAAVCEMRICLVELFMFGSFAIGAHFLGKDAFIIVFVSSMLATALINREIKNNYKV